MLRFGLSAARISRPRFACQSTTPSAVLATLCTGPAAVSPRVEAAADAISQLSLLEVSELCDVLKEKFGMNQSDLFMPIVAGGGGGGAAGAEEQADEPAAEARTHFDLKLTEFDPKKKIAVIKEVRALTSLGLKEAKELVESAPCVIVKDMKKEDAEAFVETLQGLGAAGVLE